MDLVSRTNSLHILAALLREERMCPFGKCLLRLVGKADIILPGRPASHIARDTRMERAYVLRCGLHCSINFQGFTLVHAFNQV